MNGRRTRGSRKEPWPWPPLSTRPNCPCLNVRGIKPDSKLARQWYERARQLGAGGAEERLRQLGAN